jgi:hypothetical protein
MLAAPKFPAGAAEAPARRRRAPGTPWQPGQSGNPSGKPREPQRDGVKLGEYARQRTFEALDIACEVMRDRKASRALQLQAADIVLRLGWGNAPKQDTALAEELVIVVQQLVQPAAPVAGVLASPVAESVQQGHRTHLQLVENGDEATP